MTIASVPAVISVSGSIRSLPLIISMFFCLPRWFCLVLFRSLWWGRIASCYTPPGHLHNCYRGTNTEKLASPNWLEVHALSTHARGIDYTECAHGFLNYTLAAVKEQNLPVGAIISIMAVTSVTRGTGSRLLTLVMFFWLFWWLCLALFLSLWWLPSWGRRMWPTL
jgi:hypothetical protein